MKQLTPNYVGRCLLSILLVLFVGTPSFAQDFDYHRDFKDMLAKSKDKKSEFNYAKLLKRFNAADTTLTEQEVIALQIGFTADKNYTPYSTLEQEREIMKLVSDEKYEDAITAADKLLKTNPVNFTALLEKSFSYLQLNKSDAPFHKEKIMLLIEANLWSGDGSREHPIFVLSPIDGQTIIRYILGGDIGSMGSGSDPNGYFLDILEMHMEPEEEGGEATTMTLNFIIQHAVDKMFTK